MKDDKKGVTPLFVNGELNDGSRKKYANNNNEKLPTKRYGFSDFLLTLVGIALIGYGIYSYINKEDAKQIEENDSNVVENSNSNVSSNKQKEPTKEEKIDKIIKQLTMNEVEEKKVFNENDINLMVYGIPVENLSDNAKLALSSKTALVHSFENNLYITEEDMNNAVKSLFGDIEYTKLAFSCGNRVYTYNQEIKRFFIYSDFDRYNLNYKKYNYFATEEIDNKLIIKNYVAYTLLDNTKSTTLKNTALNTVINENNIEENYKDLKYYEYEFGIKEGKYYLEKITIK